MNTMALWTRLWSVLLVVTMMTAGCASPPSAQSETPEDGRGKTDVLVLEVEGFTLKQAQIKEDKKASGGKLVLFNYISGSAETMLHLRKGEYEVTAYALAPDTDKDAFYLLGPGMNVRVWPEEVWKISAAKPARMTVKKDGPVALKIEPTEIDVMVDRLEIRRAE